ncbi:RloB family protein [Nocardiopsis alba]|uniref:RloB family protein n=1 Tax=Nocardiopsis alba TaxID=53437 RepID=UPI0033CE5A30
MRKGRSHGRRPGPRREHAKVLILGEGETEREYFTGLRQHFRAVHGVGGHSAVRAVEPVFVEIAQRTAAKLIVKEALDRRSEGYSQIWAVFDTEGEDVTHLRSQIRDTRCSAAEATVHTAISHPTFEIWLLLHHLGRGALNGCHRPKDTERLLKETVPSWAKGQARRGKPGTDFADFRGGLDKARAQAARTMTDHYDDYPWTDVHTVVDTVEKHYTTGLI